MGDADADWTLPLQRSLPEIVADRVMEAIRDGDLAPGARIVEETLAKRLGVSRGPLREALKALQAQHLVQSVRGRGTRVAHVSDEQILQMQIVRAVLEGLAARLFAGQRTKATVKVLDTLHARIVAAALAGQSAEWRELDWQFHETLVRLSGNPVLLKSWESISRLVRLFLREHPGFDHKVTAVLDNHERLMGALRTATPDEAEAIFRSTLLRSGHARMGAEPVPALASLIDGSAEILRILPKKITRGRAVT